MDVLFVELFSRSLYLLLSFGEPILGGIGLSILSVSVSICTSACRDVGLLNLFVGVNCEAGVELKGFTS